MSAHSPDPDSPISEPDVLRVWGCLSKYRLKRARYAGEIEWVPGPRGTPYYQPSAVRAFIERVKKPCRAPEKPHSLNSAGCGSPEKEQARSTIDSGLTKDLHKLSAYSIRHKVVTVLRKAGVHSDMISAQMGHKAPGARVTAGYGEYAPDYLKPAADALDAWWMRLPVTGRSLFLPVAENVVELRRA